MCAQPHQVKKVDFVHKDVKERAMYERYKFLESKSYTDESTY
jgi:hypothetical protein